MSPRLLEAAHSGEGQLLAVFSFPEHEKFSYKICVKSILYFKKGQYATWRKQ